MTPSAVARSDPSHAEASWIAIGSLAVSTFAIVTAELLPVGLVPAIARDTRITDGQAGLMLTVTGVLSALAAPASIVVAGHVDRKRLLLALLAILAVANAVVGIAAGLTELLVGRVLLGVTVGSFWTIAGSLGPRLRRGPAGIRASAVILSGISIGTVAGVPTGALIGDLVGWRVAFFAASALAVLSMLPLIAWLPPIHADGPRRFVAFGRIVRTGRARSGLLAAAFAFVGQFTAYTYIAPFLERDGIGGAGISVILLASGVAGFVGNLAGGRLAEWNVRGAAVTMAVLLGASMAALDLMGRNPIVAVALIAIWGTAFGMLPITMQSWMYEAAPDQLEGLQSIFVSVAQLAIAAGALAGGALIDHLGLDAALLCGSSCATIAAAIMLRAGSAPMR